MSTFYVNNNIKKSEHTDLNYDSKKRKKSRNSLTYKIELIFFKIFRRVINLLAV